MIQQHVQALRAHSPDLLDPTDDEQDLADEAVLQQEGQVVTDEALEEALRHPTVYAHSKPFHEYEAMIADALK